MTSRRTKRNTRWKLIQFALFSCILILVFFLVWLRTTVVNQEYQLGQLQRQKTEIVRQGQLLFAEKSNSYSMKKIEDNAVDKLGMSLPQRDRVYFVERTKGAAPYKVSVKRSVSRGFLSAGGN